VLLAGTRKGLFIGRSDGVRETWAWEPPAFPMEEVYAVSVDPASGTVLVGSSHPAFGPAVYRSSDVGRTFDATKPATVQLPADVDASAERAGSWRTPRIQRSSRWRCPLVACIAPTTVDRP